LLPPTAVIVQHSTVYDGWRHLYFIYPAFLFFAVLGVASLSRAATRLAAYFKPARAVLLLLVAVPVAGVGLTMARMHPHEYVYFNRLAGPAMGEIKSNFEMDYWGLTCREGLEYLLQHDPSPQIRVFAATDPGRLNALILPAQQRSRICFTSRS